MALPGTGTALMLLQAFLGTHCPVMVVKKVLLGPQTTVGLPVKLVAHTAVQLAPGAKLLQSGDQPTVLLGRPGRVVVLQAARQKKKAATQTKVQTMQQS